MQTFSMLKQAMNYVDEKWWKREKKHPMSRSATSIYKMSSNSMQTHETMRKKKNLFSMQKKTKSKTQQKV